MSNTLLSIALACLAATWPAGTAASGASGVLEAATTPHVRGSALQGRDPVAHLRMWLRNASEGRAGVDKRSLDDLKHSIEDLRILWSINPPRSEEITLVLLDLLGFTLGYQDLSPNDPEAPLLEVRGLAAEALKTHMDADTRQLLARKVLALPHSQPTSRRIAAAWLAVDTHAPEMKLALFGCAKDPDPRLRAVALDALVGWEDEGVHQLFLNQLVQWLAGNPLADGARAEAHFKTVHIPPGSRVLVELAAIVKARLASSDWRSVSQAVALSRPLEHAVIMPFLIEALASWKKRADTGGQGLRLEYEILRALEQRSGRKLGPAPESWREWWSAVQRGEVRGQSPSTTGGAPEPTRASFFGLKPVTDRVTFVIDRSGSMDGAFGKEGPGSQSKRRTRWDEAVGQLLGFVEAIGEKSRFNVVVFHDYAEAWKPKLVEADKANLKAVREWLRLQHPGGGTALRSGIDRAFFLDAAGLPDLAALEADTLIVLCDGATNEGPEWVSDFMKRANALARVRFDCAEIGREGDGTLARLARESGGDYVRIDG